MIALQNLKIDYSHSKISFYWIPLSFIILYTAKLQIFSNSYQFINYPIYLYIGLVLWYFIYASITKSTGLFLNNNLLLNIKVNPLSLLSIAYVNNIYRLILNLFLIFPLYFIYEFNFNFLFFIAALFINLIVIYNFAKLACAISIIFNDFHNIMTTLFGLLFFLSPIFWHPSILTNEKKFIIEYNPIFYLIEIARDAAMNSEFYENGFKICLILICILILLNSFVSDKIISNVSKSI